MARKPPKVVEDIKKDTGLKIDKDIQEETNFRMKGSKEDAIYRQRDRNHTKEFYGYLFTSIIFFFYLFIESLSLIFDKTLLIIEYNPAWWGWIIYGIFFIGFCKMVWSLFTVYTKELLAHIILVVGVIILILAIYYFL